MLNNHVVTMKIQFYISFSFKWGNKADCHTGSNTGQMKSAGRTGWLSLMAIERPFIEP